MRLFGVARTEALLMASNTVYHRFVWAGIGTFRHIGLDLLPITISLPLHLSWV
jgi:hypothetical protein